MILVPTADAHPHAKHEHRQGQTSVDRHKHHLPAGIKWNAPAPPALSVRPTLPDLSPDLATAKKAIDLVGQGKTSAATAAEASIADPVVRKLVEWTLLRRADGVGFRRYDAFITANPDWPSIPFLRQRAEAILWKERADAARARSFVTAEPPRAIGKLVLARVLLSEREHADAV